MENLNTIICGDNLQILKQMRGKVDLVYLDPPYATEFMKEDSDETIDSINLLVRMLRPRVILLHELLADSGSLYFHCDWRTAAYVQILLDEIFGPQNLIAKIIWQRSPIASPFQRFVSNTYDVIFFYSKSRQVKYFPQYMPYSKSEMEARYKYVEEETGNRYRLVNLTTANSEPPRYTYEFLGVTRNWRFSKEKMEEEFKQGRIVQSRPGSVPMRKQYMNEGKLIGDVWTDISKTSSDLKERTGYATQRPLLLLQRIIVMSTEQGDVVLDPFCGSGTTLVAAEKLGRKWIGIDISPTACDIATERIAAQRKDMDVIDVLQVQNQRAYKEIISLPAYEFESWAISTLKKVLKENTAYAKLRGLEMMSGADIYPITLGNQLNFGFDYSSRSVPVMVKQKEKTEGKEIEKFAIQLNHHQQNEGIYIALSFLKSAQAEAVKKQKEGLKIILISAKELLRT